MGDVCSNAIFSHVPGCYLVKTMDVTRAPYARLEVLNTTTVRIRAVPDHLVISRS